MALTPDSSLGEWRVAQRQLYRAGQTPPASKAPPSEKKDKPSFWGRIWGASASAASAGASVKTPPPSTSLPAPSPQPPAKSPKPGLVKQPSRLQRFWNRNRKYILAVLGLLLLGTVSYCIFLPDRVEEAKQELQAIRNDPNLDGKERWEKTHKIMSSLSNKQKADMSKEGRAKMRERLDAFFKLSPEQQVAEMKKQIEESEKRRAQWQAQQGANGGGGGGSGGPGAGNRGGGLVVSAAEAKQVPVILPGAGNRGGGLVMSARKLVGPGGGGPVVIASGNQKTVLDMLSPEERARMNYMRGLNNQIRQSMGLPPSNSVVFIGPPGGSGSPPGRR